MMTPTDGLNALVGATALLLCWVLATFFYRDYRVDLFRQRMFAERDALFEYAAAGGISFQHPAYAVVRTTMNGFIRFADRMTLSAVIATAWAYRGSAVEAETFSARYAEVTTDLTAEQRDHLSRFVSRMNAHAIEQVICSSPLLLLAVAPIAFAVVAMQASKDAGRLFIRKAFPARWSRVVDSFALSYGAEAAYA